MTMRNQTLQAQRSHRVLALAAATSLSFVLTACGGGKSDQAAPAATVNKEALSAQLIDDVLAAQRVKPELADAVGRQVLERLIDQTLVVQKATELKLDSDPKVQRLIEQARRDILTRAYAERLGQDAAKPTDAEIAKYYADRPALFSERRIYSLQELNIEAKPEQLAELQSHLGAAKTLAEYVEYLRSQDFRFNAGQAVRAAEQLPNGVVDSIAKLKDGQSLVIPGPKGMQVVYLQGSRSQPLDEARARPLIEQILVNQRKAELGAKEVKALREAAKIEYQGRFAGKPADAASAPVDAASLLAPAASEAAAK